MEYNRSAGREETARSQVPHMRYPQGAEKSTGYARRWAESPLTHHYVHMALSAVILTAPLAALALVGTLAMAAPISQDAPGAPATPAIFRLPVAGAPTVTRTFHAPLRRYGAGHRGVDLASRPAAAVLAAAAGKVGFAGTVAGRGVVRLDHSAKVHTTYEPVTPAVRSGTTVNAGEVIGWLESGHAGCPVRACLHWGVKQEDQYFDPMSLLLPATGAVRLLPLKPGDAAPKSGMSSTRSDRLPRFRPSGVLAHTRQRAAPLTRACRSAWSPNWNGRDTPAPLADLPHLQEDA